MRFYNTFLKHNFHIILKDVCTHMPNLALIFFQHIHTYFGSTTYTYFGTTNYKTVFSNNSNNNNHQKKKNYNYNRAV